MSSKVYSVTTILSLLGLFHETRANSADTSIGYVIEDIQENLAPYKVNFIFPSSDQLSPLAERIVEQTNEELASANIDEESLSKILNANLTQSQLKSYGYDRILERLSLTMAIVESRNGSKALRKMFTCLKHFHILNPLTRGKYLVNLITEQSLDLEPFFRKAWSEHFLELTVLEWIQENESKLRRPNSVEIEYTVRVHSFNPFNNTFCTEILNERTQLFPDKVNNLFGLSIYKDLYLGYHEYAVKALDFLNATMVDVEMLENLIDKHPMHYVKNYNRTFLRGNSLLGKDNGLILDLGARTLDAFFFLMRRKKHEVKVSVAAIVAFGGLSFTAFIFTVWAKFLGFEEPNWSFLNILTAQMGGSIQFQGRLRLSKAVFQMSIYIATFIIVTIGSDYMYQIFIYDQELPQIRTMRDLASSNIDFVMDKYEYELWKSELGHFLNSDSTLQTIFNRITETRVLKATIYFPFCRRESREVPIEDNLVNICINDGDLYEMRNSMPDDRYQIDRIEDPIIMTRGFLTLGMYPFLQYRVGKIIRKMSGAGFFLKIERDEIDSVIMRSLGGEETHSKEGENDEVPLEKQLWPVLAVGYTLGIAVLISEIFWKRFIAKTELGRLMVAFYNNSHHSSARSPLRQLEVRHFSR
ncbi:hypothetical protein QAD02_022854 [Eretmocerus hayati]|uniref:Uncharacterized protein n=1 Tax=Eretmocerus hayati TaxID=131215 RepID=A0ACC2PZ34_9HYME|nr:hypothetical protein QAD02_022854 [Eretmocerus hayati]